MFSFDNVLDQKKKRDKESEESIPAAKEPHTVPPGIRPPVSQGLPTLSSSARGANALPPLPNAAQTQSNNRNSANSLPQLSPGVALVATPASSSVDGKGVHENTDITTGETESEKEGKEGQQVQGGNRRGSIQLAPTGIMAPSLPPPDVAGQGSGDMARRSSVQMAPAGISAPSQAPPSPLPSSVQVEDTSEDVLMSSSNNTDESAVPVPVAPSGIKAPELLSLDAMGKKSRERQRRESVVETDKGRKLTQDIEEDHGTGFSGFLKKGLRKAQTALSDKRKEEDSSEEEEEQVELIDFHAHTTDQVLEHLRVDEEKMTTAREIRVGDRHMRIKTLRELQHAKKEFEKAAEEYEQKLKDPYLVRKEQLSGLLKKQEMLQGRVFEAQYKVDMFVFGDHGCEVIATALGANQYLEKLDLSHNNIGPKGGDIIGSALSVNKHMQELILRHNPLGTNGVSALCIALTQNTHSKLRSLNIRNTGAGTGGATALGNLLNNNKTLENINARHNGFGEEGAKVLAEGLKNNTTLKKFDLSTNNFGIEGIRHFANIVHYGAGEDRNETLDELNLEFNDTNEALREDFKLLMMLRVKCVKGVWDRYVANELAL